MTTDSAEDSSDHFCAGRGFSKEVTVDHEYIKKEHSTRGNGVVDSTPLSSRVPNLKKVSSFVFIPVEHE